MTDENRSQARQRISFGLKTMFVLVAVVAAFFGGRQSMVRRVSELEDLRESMIETEGQMSTYLKDVQRGLAQAQNHAQNAEQRAVRAEQRVMELNQVIADRLSYDLYTDEFAEQLESQLPDLNSQVKGLDRDEAISLLKSHEVDVDHLPKLENVLPEGYLESYRLSPSYILQISFVSLNPQTTHNFQIMRESMFELQQQFHTVLETLRERERRDSPQQPPIQSPAD